MGPSAHPPRTPVVVGVAQRTWRQDDPRDAPEPLEVLAQLGRRAAEDAGPGDALLRCLDAVGVVEVIGWSPANAPRRLGERLGEHLGAPVPLRAEWVTATGGEMGVKLVNRAAERIAAGESRVALVAGCNAVKTLADAHRAGVPLAWDPGGEGTPRRLGESRWGTDAREQAYGLRAPPHVYPLFENALRAHLGRSPAEHQARLGRLMSRFTEVAAKNPHAWFPTYRSPEELVSVTADNRLIAWPYPKYLNAVLTTDQAAVVLIASAEAAGELGVPPDRQVAWRGGAEAEEPAWFPSQRRDFHSAPALGAAARGALARAGLGTDELAFFDFYSCFPVAVEMALRELGLDEDDPRGFTVTGGLPYAGGPGSSYTLHALAALTERLRENPGAAGLVTGLGWYFTKHAAVVLASGPPPSRVPERRAEPEPPALPGPVAVLDEARGRAAVETYTVIYDREGAPAKGIVVGRLADGGARFLAATPRDRDVLESLVGMEGVGRPGRVEPRDGRNVFDPR